MNRAERRRNARTEKPRTYVLTEDQINKMKQDVVDAAARRAFLMFMSIPVMVLHDKFGFGKIRLERFMDYALLWFNSVQNNEARLTELLKIASDECGININDYNGRNKDD